ncbi:MAG: (deoxy)nucleoside triphosphate pyrophosphohydrolase [Pseudomonadota bacterium]
MKLVLVSAVAMVNSDGHILLAQRPEGKSMAGLWEFPGGKVEQGETPEAALCRELQEELGIRTDPNSLKPITFASHTYESFHLLMPLYACRHWDGVPVGAEGQALAWVEPTRLHEFPAPEADLPLFDVLAKLKAW